MIPRFFILLLAVLAPALALGARILLAGDSTMAHITSETQQGWGTPFKQYTSLEVVNLARGGRSARSYTREGLWAALAKQIQKGDYVVIEFGHNDGGSPQTSERAPVAGTGSETLTVTLKSGEREVVQTFPTYIKRMVSDVLKAGGIPIVSSQTPNGDAWDSAKKKIGTPVRFVGMAKIAADAFPGQAWYVDHWNWCAVRYEDMGYSKVYPKLFPVDHTHTNPAGADVVAQAFVNGLKCTNNPLAKFLTAKGNAIPKVCS